LRLIENTYLSALQLHEIKLVLERKGNQLSVRTSNFSKRRCA